MMSFTHEQSAAYRGRSDGPSFVLKEQPAGRTSRHSDSTAAADRWRIMGVWATTLLKASKHSAPPKGLTDYALILKTKILDKGTWKLSDKTLMGDLLQVTESLSHQDLMSRVPDQMFQLHG